MPVIYRERLRESNNKKIYQVECGKSRNIIINRTKLWYIKIPWFSLLFRQANGILVIIKPKEHFRGNKYACKINIKRVTRKK